MGTSTEWDGRQPTRRLLIQAGEYHLLPLLKLLLGLGEGSERSIPVPTGCFQRMLAEDVLGGSNVGEGFGGEGYFHAATVGPPAPAARGLVTVSEVSQGLRSPQAETEGEAGHESGSPGCPAASWRHGGCSSRLRSVLIGLPIRPPARAPTGAPTKAARGWHSGPAGVFQIDARLA